MPRTDLHQQLQWAEAEIEELEAELKRLVCQVTEERERREKAERIQETLRVKLREATKRVRPWRRLLRGLTHGDN